MGDALFISSGSEVPQGSAGNSTGSILYGGPGFNVNDRRAGDELDKIVGYKFVPQPAQLRVPDDKWARTHAALLFRAGQRKVDIEL